MEGVFANAQVYEYPLEVKVLINSHLESIIFSKFKPKKQCYGMDCQLL